MSHEYWNVYDEDRRKTNKIVIRGDKSFGNDNLSKGEYHLVIHVCIFNSKDEMLIQKRQTFKSTLADMWDLTVGGSALKGENAKEAAIREVKEEIGYDICLDDKREHLSINFDRGFDNFYLLKEDLDINKLELQYEEVQDIKWASKKQILDMIDKKEFVPYYPEIIELLFAMQGRGYGSHIKKL